MSDVQVFADVEAAVKAWAKAHPLLTPLIAGRVFLAPNANSAAHIHLERVGGTADASEAPVDHARIRFHCWSPNNNQAAAIAYTVMRACREMTANTPMGAAAVGFGARVLSGPVPVRIEADQLAGWHRYRLDVEFSIRAA